MPPQTHLSKSKAQKTIGKGAAPLAGSSEKRRDNKLGRKASFQSQPLKRSSASSPEEELKRNINIQNGQQDGTSDLDDRDSVMLEDVNLLFNDN